MWCGGLCNDDILHRDRHTGKGTDLFALGDLLINALGRLRERDLN